MGEVAIKFENISKQYRLGTIGTGTLSHDLNRWWTVNIRRKEDPYLKVGQVNERDTKATDDYVWALKSIDFEVKKGEVLGIIGKNGAGKSTLLKILSRVTSPSTGRILTQGRIASLLEVGTGFHPEMTGRENIFMNGSIMGMTKAEIRKKFDEIVDFAGVEKYIETPVKRYSSGMTVRLGFAIAAHLDPEILVVDEVLAVGDAEFQRKAIGRMQDVSSNEGRTVLFVSHNMGSISQLCSKAILLKSGYVYSEGPTSDVIRSYLQASVNNGKIEQDSITGPLVPFVSIENVTVNEIDNNSIFVSPFREIRIGIKGNCKKALEFFRIGITLNINGMKLLSLHDYPEPIPIEKGSFEREFVIPAYLLRPGDYTLSVYGHDDGNSRKGTEWLYANEILVISVLEEWDQLNDSHNQGIINLVSR